MTISKTDTGRFRARVKSGRQVVADRTFDRKGDAEKFEDEQRRRLDLGTFVDPKAGRISVRNAADRWMVSRADSVASSTLREEGYAIAAMPADFARRPLGTIRQSELEALYGSMLATRARSTVSRFRNTLSSLFGWAVRESLISTNPVTLSRVPRGSGETVSQEVYPFTIAELRNVVAEIRDRSGDDAADVALVLSLTGLRWGELVALRVRDVQSVPYPALRVSRSKPDGAPVRYVTKGGKARTVPLTDDALAAIAPRLTNRHPDAPVFPNASGGFLHGANYKRRIKWAEVSRGRRIHDLRHTAATIWLRNGVDVKTVQNWLGHSTATLTVDTYAHWLGTDADAAAVARMNAVLAQSGGRRGDATPNLRATVVATQGE